MNNELVLSDTNFAPFYLKIEIPLNRDFCKPSLPVMAQDTEMRHIFLLQYEPGSG